MVECLNVVKSLILINAFLKGWVLTFFLKKCYDHVASLIITEILRHVDVIYEWLQRFSSLFC